MATRRAPSGPTPPEGISDAEERAHATALAESARPRLPNDRRPPPVADTPPAPVEPIVVAPKEPAPDPKRDPKFPRLRKVVFTTPIAFSVNQMPTQLVDIGSEHYQSNYSRLELCEYLGERMVLVARKNPEVKGGEVIYRVPWAGVATFMTWDDNPDMKDVSISVNEQAKAVQVRA